VFEVPARGEGRGSPFGAIARFPPLARRGNRVPYSELLARSQAGLDYQFRDPSLLVTALTHASVAENRFLSNERLEFLGDSVLGMVICEQLFRMYPDCLEGDMTKMKSMLVSRRVCAQVADEIGLGDQLILGNGIKNRSNLPTSIRAAVLESIIGAIFIDGGFEPAQAFILRSMMPHIERSADLQNHDNHKSALQQLAQRLFATMPRYETLDEQGPDHSKCFEICVAIEGERFPSAWGPSKKEAEQEAARKALECLENKHRSESRSSTGP